MNSFSERLREQREKLELTQAEFGELAGVKKRSQINYEKGERNPDSEYLEAIARAGVDVAYVITGVSSKPELPPSLAADEQVLVDAYRDMPMAKRKAMLAALLMGEEPAPKAKPKAKKPAEKAKGVFQVEGGNNSIEIGGSVKTKIN